MRTDRPKGTELYEHEQELFDYQGEDRLVKSEELAATLAESDAAAFKVPTGMASLDRILDNIEAGELIVVTGPTGQGKTTLLMTITNNMAKAGHDTCWFTLEVTPRQFMQKIVANSNHLPQFYIPKAGIDFADEEYVKRWEAKHKRHYEMVDWIEDKIIEAKVKYETEDKPLKAVFIDHVHMLFSVSRFTGNLSLEIGDLVAKIKDIALQHNLAVFLIAHCKDIPDNTSREIRMEDIRDSGMISRLADAVIGVWRIPNEDDGTKGKTQKIGENDTKSKVAVFKNRRNGKLGFFTAYHDNHYLNEDPF